MFPLPMHDIHGESLQRVLTSLFQNLPYVTVYVDDIQIATPALLSLHIECVTELLHRLRGWSLVSGQLIPDSPKISNIHNWPLPTTGKTVSRYLGFFNYFCGSIPMYATLAAKLDSLSDHNRDDIIADPADRDFIANFNRKALPTVPDSFKEEMKKFVDEVKRYINMKRMALIAI